MMKGDFYRLRGGTRLKGAAKRLLKNKRSLFTLFAALIAVLYVLFDNRGVVRRISLEMKKRELTEATIRAREEMKILQAHLKAVEGDKKTIERLARERYGMAREGETVYRVKKD
jgi:cell division protein FtsB